MKQQEGPVTTTEAHTAGAGCPVCGASAGQPFVRIVGVPVHCNVLWPSAESARDAPRGDLDLVFCQECGHLHNAAFDAARTTYGGAYENSLHHSDVFQEYASALVEDLVERHGLRRRDIVEVGAGQGNFLEMLCRAGQNRCTGFDPSFVGERDEDGVRVVPAFYDEQFSDYPADVIVCRHVLEHIDRSGDFVAMIRRVIGHRDHVLAFFEVPDAVWTLRGGGIWDLIYEHCGYFTAQSLRYVFASNGFRVDRLDTVFGGQFLVLEATPATGPTELPSDHSAHVSALAEDAAAFAATYTEHVTRWRQRLVDLARVGQTAVVWGAGSKGVTFLNTVDPSGVVDRAVDINPRKRGMHVAGTGQLIVGPDELVERPPDVVLVMNPNYRDEIATRLAELGLRSTMLEVVT